MNIRPETPADYAAIADMTIRAFGQRLGEALLVALARQHPFYDPELSLVAEVNGQVAGHALFIPYTIRLMGQDMRAVNLAPLTVAPAQQRQGIGGALIAEGHRIASAKGYTLSLLLGHKEYYPRFGYITRVFGASSVEITKDQLSRLGGLSSYLQRRNPVEADIPALLDLWRREEANIDFVVQPGASLMDWLSPDTRMEANVFLREGEIVGYARVLGTEPGSAHVFLARDDDAALKMAAELISVGAAIKLPLHPYSASASAFGIPPTVNAWDAAMACRLAPGLFDEYYAALTAGTRLPGRPIWPTMFELA